MSWVYKCLVLVSIAAAFDAGAVDQPKSRGANVYQKVTGDDSEEDRSRWDAIFNTKTYVYGEEPAVFLRDHVNLLPVGRALDIAMGEGRNAVYLAKKGFRVVGVDISDVALRKARNLARKNKVSIETVRQDLQTYTITAGAYDVILDINYLQRNLIPQIKRGLRKGGVVVFEGYTVDQLNNPNGQSMPREYLLNKGELIEMFRDFEIIKYQETNDGKEAFASLIARKK